MSYLSLNPKNVIARLNRSRLQELAGRRNWLIVLAKGAFANLRRVVSSIIAPASLPDHLDHLEKDILALIDISFKASKQDIVEEEERNA